MESSLKFPDVYVMSKFPGIISELKKFLPKEANMIIVPISGITSIVCLLLSSAFTFQNYRVLFFVSNFMCFCKSKGLPFKLFNIFLSNSLFDSAFYILEILFLCKF